MKVVFALLLFSISLFAFSVKDFVQAYQNHKYTQVCNEGVKNLQKIRKDENLLNIYAFSCLYADKLYRLGVPILLLTKSPQARKNRAYFSLILAQKNILVSSLLDNISFHNLSVPNTDYILSRVFTLYFQKKYNKKDGKYIMNDEKGEYKLYVKRINGKRWVIIEEKKNNKTFLHRFR